MKKRSCYLFVFDGFADWEPSIVTAGLNTYSDFEIKTFSVDGRSVNSMGNLTVNADLKLKDVKHTDFDLIVLPGGNKWEEGGNTEITQLIKDTFRSGKIIAAICAATTFLAKQGLYRDVKHTSNGLEYLKKQVPEYSDYGLYINEPCVSDKNIITANGAAMIEFAYKIFEHFDILKKEELVWWLKMYKSAGMSY
ncbi:MAG: type 1 glutamine amidotransferase family protein [Bacteroidales bacterium]